MLSPEIIVVKNSNSAMSKILAAVIAILLIIFNIYLVNYVSDNIINKSTVQPVKRNPLDYLSIDRTNDSSKVIGLYIVGIIAIIISLFITNSAIKYGLLIGGILTILYGFFRDWSQRNELYKLIIFAVGLIVVIYMAYRLYNKQSIISVTN